jgi:hypothetical protein
MERAQILHALAETDGLPREALEAATAQRAELVPLAGGRYRGDARGDIDRNAADIVAFQLDLSGMQPAAYRDTQGLHRVGDGAGTAHCARRSVKGREKAVAGMLHLPPAEPRELLSHDLVVAVERGNARSCASENRNRPAW